MSKIEWLGTPATVGQYRAAALVQPVRRIVDVPVSRLPTDTRTCPGRMTWHVDHTHQLRPLASYLTVTISGEEGFVDIPRADVLAGAQKIYVTSSNHGHTHTFTLTAAEMTALRSGRTIRKETSRDARVRGRPHTHTVNLSCVSTLPRGFSPQVIY